MDWLIYIGYVAIVAVVVFLSIKLGKYVDVIDNKSNISGAFIGGVMLAAVTSLPELFTSISAIFVVKENSMIIGNILGSDLINCAFFGVMLLVFFRGLKSARFQKFYYIALGVLAAMYALTALALAFGSYLRIAWYNVVSVCILVLYVFFIRKTPKSSESDGESKDEGITLKQAVIRFIICAVILIAASIAMTYVTDIVADKLDLGKTFAGALFLGVATSLPELISSSTLCYRKNFDAAAGNIIGSNIFNFMILVVADFLTVTGNSNIYELNTDSVVLLVLGAVATVVMFCMMLVKNMKKQSVGTMLGVQSLNLVMPGLYVLYLLVAVRIITLPFTF